MEDTKKQIELKDFFQSKKFKWILAAIGIIIIALLIFQAGIFIGYRKASFSFHFGENYYRAFGRSQSKFMRGIPRENFPSAYGAIGKIIKINLPTLIVESSDNVEKTVLIKDNTIIRQFRDAIKPSDLKLDNFITVIGSPNDNGQIEARLVRIAPPPPGMTIEENANQNKKQ